MRTPRSHRSDGLCRTIVLAVFLVSASLQAAPPDDSGGFMIRLEAHEGVFTTSANKPIAERVVDSSSGGVRYRLNFDLTDPNERQIRRFLLLTWDLDDPEIENEIARGICELAAVHPAVAQTAVLYLWHGPQPSVSNFDPHWREKEDDRRIVGAMLQSCGLDPTPYACCFDARGPMMGQPESDGPWYLAGGYTKKFFAGGAAALRVELQKPWVAARAEASLVLGHDVASKLTGAVFEPKTDERPRSLTNEERAELKSIIADALKAQNEDEAK